MRIISLYVTEGFNHKTLDFDHRTLLYSKENTQGKTTAIRLLLYAFGYQIRGIGDFKFDYNVETEITIENNNTIYVLRRNNNHLALFNKKLDSFYSFILPTQLYDAHVLIYGFQSRKFIDSLLGIFYVDQTQGSVTLNRGKVIGGISFSIDDLIVSLDDKDIENIQNEIDVESKKLKEYRGLTSIAKYIGQNNFTNGDVDLSIEGKSDKVFVIKNEIKRIKEEIKNINQSINKNTLFIETIENYKLYVSYQNEEIPVNQKTIRGYDDNKGLLRARKDILLSNLNDKQNELKLYQEIPEDIFPDIKLYKEKIDRQLAGLDLKVSLTDNIVKDTEKKLRMLRKEKSRIIEHNSSVIQYMNTLLIEIGREFELQIDKSGIRTHEVQNKSGAYFFKTIIAYRIVYLLSVQKFSGIKLPLIIDSLRTSEVTEDNATDIIEMIKKYIPDYQIIIASVYKYDRDFIDKELVISNPLISEFG